MIIRTPEDLEAAAAAAAALFPPPTEAQIDRLATINRGESMASPGRTNTGGQDLG
ncbi:hypothetical protein [Mycolicibacterium tusciae]|uniref:hypothetical protein n=1 Tax=Mycolicibacterium tusciae TaxID=75922 RepID=UPI00024A230D|nr:hypothetical protein [Mycolicibacterium tusciae]